MANEGSLNSYDFLERNTCAKHLASPVLRLYASPPRTSLLQGTASTGARWPRQYSIFEVAGAPTLFLTLNRIDCHG
ncbi:MULTISPECIES: hypothetical protein [unclassified Pedobacter]|uniref:hypothetical protein n=1 Tax=unclassified Pedobacter TaxID=2628915 RepID=UPI001E59CE9E|nr:MULTISPECIES: hypothetical protein [unclassified Pedobacter]